MSRFGAEKVGTSRFGATKVQTGDRDAANDFLDKGFQFTPEENEAVTGVLSPQDMEMKTYTNWLNISTGTNHTPEMARANLEYEYGKDATPQVANQMNKKALKWYKDIPAYTGKLTAGAAAQMPKLRGEMSQLYDKFTEDMADKFGVIAEIKKRQFEMIPGVKGFLLANKTWDLVPTEKLQEWGAEQVKEATEIQSEYMSGVPLEKSLAEGDFETAGKDIGTAIAFESPRMALQIAIGLVSPEASLEMMGVTAMGAKRAEKTEEDSLEERVLAPVAIGAIEVATEKLLGTGRIIDAIASKEVKKGIANRLRQIVTDVTGGAISESGATFGENVVDRISGEDVDLKEGVLLSGIVGAVMDVGAGQIMSPMTLGDANRMRKQMSNEEIDSAVESGEFTPEMGDAIKTPTEQNVEAANQSVFEPEATEPIQEVGQPKVQEIRDPEGLIEGKEIKPIGKTKNSDVVDTEESLVEQGYDLSHRRKDGLHPSETGYVVQFASDFSQNKHYGDEHYLIKSEELSDVPDFILDDALAWLRENVNKNATETNADYMVFPYNIEDGAGIWDESSFIEKLKKERANELSGVIGFNIGDGAVVIYPERASFGVEGKTTKPEVEDAIQERQAEEVPVREQAERGEEIREAQQEEIGAEEEGGRVGISKAWNQVEEWIPFDRKTLTPETVTQKETVKSAFDKGLHNRIDEIKAKVDKKQAINSEEVGALLIRKAEVSNQIESIRKQMEQATKDGDMDALARLGNEMNEQLDFAAEITETARRGATETARALAAMAMEMDKKTFDLVNVVTTAQATKGSDLTTEQKESLTEKVEELEAVEVDIEKLRSERKKSAKKKLSDMLRDQKKFEEQKAKTIELIEELENAHRNIRTKKEKGEDPNADLKILKKRQDQIFDKLAELEAPKPRKPKKTETPDSQGYSEYIKYLDSLLSEVRKERKLDTDIAQMEADLKSGDLSAYEKTTKEQLLESDEIAVKRGRALALKKEISRQIADMKPKTIGSVASDVWDVFRNLKLTADAGHLLRQGGIGMSNPKLWKSGDAQTFFKESFRALIKDNADVTDANIMAHQNYQKWKQAGLAMIEEGQQLDAREEILMNGLLGKVPKVGELQQAFGRTQITGTNLLRLIMAESYLGGRTDATLAEMKDIAKAVNILTGRGATVRDPRVNSVLNKILTSPSFTSSRFQTPFLLAHRGEDGKFLWENKPLRNRILEDYAWFLGTRLAIMGLLAQAFPDIEIGDDKDHWTFGRLIVDLGGGKTRVYDPWAGIASAYSAVRPFLKGEAGEALKRAFEGRQHPAFAAAMEARRGETMYGEEVSIGETALRSLLPISVEGIAEVIEEDTGALDLLAATATDVVGIGSVMVDTDKLNESREKAKEE